jgi:3-hydroxyisobutyrate dehydrogenase
MRVWDALKTLKPLKNGSGIMTKIGFIGLGNVGGKLAGSLIRNGHDVTVRDLDDSLVQAFVARGAKAAASPRAMAEAVDIIITCLPSPAASAAVAEGEDGFIAVMRPGQVWMEMSTTDHNEVLRLSSRAAVTAPIPAILLFLQRASAKPLTRSSLC